MQVATTIGNRTVIKIATYLNCLNWHAFDHCWLYRKSSNHGVIVVVIVRAVTWQQSRMLYHRLCMVTANVTVTIITTVITHHHEPLLLRMTVAASRQGTCYRCDSPHDSVFFLLHQTMNGVSIISMNQLG